MPPDTVTSVASKPVTDSEKVNVAVNGVIVLIFSGTPIATVGAAASHSAVTLIADAGPVLPLSSVTPFSATVIFTFTAPFGVTTSVY